MYRKYGMSKLQEHHFVYVQEVRYDEIAGASFRDVPDVRYAVGYGCTGTAISAVISILLSV